MREFHILNAPCVSEKETDGRNTSCQFYRLMAFVVPFTVMTFTGLVCQNYSVIVAPTVGLLAGATSFGLYSLIKLTLRTARAAKPVRVKKVEVIEQW